jgi:hypothetical protein
VNGRTVLIVAVAFAALGGCGTGTLPSASPHPLIHIINRSNTALALGPGFTIPACGSASATLEAYEAEQAQIGQMMLDGT